MGEVAALALAAGAGLIGGAMNALAGGGTFAAMPALIALGLPATQANATSIVALMPGAAASAWSFRDELAPVGGIGVRALAAITFAGGLGGSVLLVLTPTRAFDAIVPWLLLLAFFAIAFGGAASRWLRARVAIGPGALAAVQALLGIYGGYFGGGVGMMTTAAYGLLAGSDPRALFALRTLMLAVANLAAAFVFAATGLIGWSAAVPMLLGGIAGGWLGARLGRHLSPRVVRLGTLAATGATTLVFFHRAYG